VKRLLKETDGPARQIQLGPVVMPPQTCLVNDRQQLEILQCQKARRKRDLQSQSIGPTALLRQRAC
jgi:hypothetical protein